MIPWNECLDEQELRRRLRTFLPAAEAESLARHVEGCPRCAVIIDAIVDGDAVALAFQTRTSSEDEPEAAGLIDRLGNLGRLPLWPAAQTGPPSGSWRTLPPGTMQQQTGLSDDFPPLDDLPPLSPPLHPGELGRLGPFRVLGVLGRGGMGVVFRAEDEQLCRPVALKVMRPALAAGKAARERFLREARAAALLRHDNVVNVFQVGEDGGVLFLAMELLEGETLEDRLRRGRLPLADVLRIGGELARGLEAAHGKGLIHRDVKPANVWIEQSGRVKILDFGVARVPDSANATWSGAIVGTPAFMAPEQARGEPATPSCDLFSLGCVLYCLTTGERPFQGDDQVSALLGVALQTPVPPRKRNPEVPAALSDLIVLLLAKCPAQRPASAAEVAEALAALEGGAPPRRARSKRRLVLAGAALLVLALFATPLVLLKKKVAVQENAEPSSLFDQLRRADVSADDLDAAGALCPEGAAPGQLVAVIGDGRFNAWGFFHDVEFSPEGDRLLCAEGGNYGPGESWLSEWDATTGKRLRTREWSKPGPGGTFQVENVREKRWLRLRDARTKKVTFSRPFGPWALRHDGARLAFADPGRSPGEVALIDPLTGKIVETCRGSNGRVRCVAFHPTAGVLACGDEGGAVRIHDSDSGELLKSLAVGKGPIQKLTFSRSGKYLAAAADELKVWRCSDWQEAASFPVSGVVAAFGPDENQLAGGGGLDNGEVVLCDVGARKVRSRFANGLAGVRSAAFSPDGGRLACGGRRLMLWDVRTGKQLILAGHDRFLGPVALHPDGRHLMRFGESGRLQAWDVVTGRLTAQVPAAPAYVDQWNPTHVSFSADGSRTAILDSSARVYPTVAAGKPLGERSRTIPDVFGLVALSPDGNVAATCSASRPGIVVVTRLDSPAQPLRFDAGRPILSPVFDPTGTRLAVSGPGSRVTVWNPTSGAQVAALEGLREGVPVMAFGPAGRWLAAVTPVSDEVIVWDVATGDRLKALPLRGSHCVYLAVSGDGRFVAATCWDRDQVGRRTDGTLNAVAPLIVWDFATGKEVLRWRSPRRLGEISFAPDGRHLIVGAGPYGNGQCFVLRLAEAGERRR